VCVCVCQKGADFYKVYQDTEVLAPGGESARQRRVLDAAAVAVEVAMLQSEVEEAQILSLDLERDIHSTVQAALRSVQEREAAVATLNELRHEAQMHTQASQMALEEALADRSLTMDDLQQLTEEIANLKVALLRGESEIAKSDAELAAQQLRAATAATAARDMQATLEQTLQCAEALATEAQRQRDAVIATKITLDEEQRARRAVGDEQQSLQRDKDELLLQLQEAAGRCSELETSEKELKRANQEAAKRCTELEENAKAEVKDLKRAKEELEAVIAQEEAIVDAGSALCREQLEQVQAKFKELTLHKSKLEGHTHKLQAQMTELQSQVRNRDGVLCESDFRVQESCSILQIAESALRAALMSAEGAMKRHAHELATLHQQVAKARTELEASCRETDRFKFELASAEKCITAKEEELKAEAIKCEQQVAQARARAFELIREHRRRSSSPARRHTQRSLSRDNSATTALSRKVQDEMLEGELECQFRLEALPDAEVRPELIRMGLANVRFFSASFAHPSPLPSSKFAIFLCPSLSFRAPHLFLKQSSWYPATTHSCTGAASRAAFRQGCRNATGDVML
jgi:hypothetical protein